MLHPPHRSSALLTDASSEVSRVPPSATSAFYHHAVADAAAADAAATVTATHHSRGNKGQTPGLDEDTDVDITARMGMVPLRSPGWVGSQPRIVLE